MPNRFSSSVLLGALQFLVPYKKQIVWASIALVFTAGLSLALVQFVRIIVDQGFVASSASSLSQAVVGLSLIHI